MPCSTFNTHCFLARSAQRDRVALGLKCAASTQPEPAAARMRIVWLWEFLSDVGEGGGGGLQSTRDMKR